MIMKGTETYANLGLSEPVRLQRQVTTLTRAVAALSVLVALLFVGLVCMAVLLYGELQGAQRRGVELELPEVDQTGRTTQDARFIAYVKKVIQQLLRNNTYIERDEEKRGISYRWDRTTPLRGREDRYSWPSLWPTSPDQHWTIPSWVPLASAQTAPPGNGNPADYAGTEERQITGTADLEKEEKEEDDDEDSFCGFDYTVDRSLAPTEPGRQRRQIAMYGNKWGKKHLTYRIINAPQGDDAERYRVQNTITRALKLWSDASPLSFYQAKEDEEADIMVKFTRGDHSDGYPFDGKGGVFAHAFFPHDGDVHFDDDEPWALDNYVATSRKDLYIIAAHELGHSLGLGHSDAWGALMRPKYTDVKWMKTISALPPEDRNAIQAMYGPCPRLEWNVRYMLESSRRSGRAPKQTRPNTCSAPYDAIFRGPDRKTYAMRGLYYWRLNDGNEIGRPMPLLIRHRWPGLPGNINAAVTSAYTGRTYFFKGNRIWRFKDSILDEYFPISHNETGLPRSPDAAFVWGPKHKIVVFKRSKFYIWNEFNRKVEPGYPKLIRKFFPGLPNNIDAAFQWKNRHTFFFKQGYYWRYDDEIGSIAKCYPRPVALYWSGCGGTSWERKQL